MGAVLHVNVTECLVSLGPVTPLPPGSTKNVNTGCVSSVAFPLRPTCPPEVVWQCVFMCFGGVALEGALKGGARIFSVGYLQNLAQA